MNKTIPVCCSSRIPHASSPFPRPRGPIMESPTAASVGGPVVLTQEAVSETGVVTPAKSLLDTVLDGAPGTSKQAASRLGEFLSEPRPAQALAYWICHSGRPHPASTRELAQLLNHDIARLDALLSDQVNAILHHPQFQKLEASWRGLRYLVDRVEEGENIKIRVLNVSWREVCRDLERALEFDQSQLFRKVYNDEFGSPGGEPFGALLGDYQICHRPAADHPTDDLGALASISHVAAASFAPFITGTHPALFGLDSFTDMEQPLNLSRTFEQAEYMKWKAFRETEDARFVSLTLPHVLMRVPYKDDGSRADGFRFHEEVQAPDRSEYLWGNAVYAFGGVLIRAFSECGWLAGIRGVQRGIEGGGLVTGLPVHSFATDRDGIAPRSSTDAVVTDFQEKELGELGFMPLCACADTELSAFYGNQSLQKPKKYDDPIATANARVSSMLQYMLTVSRFAHYLKVIARDKIGSFTGPEPLEDLLSRWVGAYVTSNDDADMETKARFPLRDAQVQVRPHPAKPGTYVAVAHLRPHFQLDELVTTVRLATELGRGRPS
jgi:type VI secretion system protein ImpD